MNQKTDFARRLRLQNSQIEDYRQTLSHLILTRTSVNLKIMEISNVSIVLKFIKKFSLTLMVAKVITLLRTERNTPFCRIGDHISS